jgi:hypothetical protein
MELMLGLLVVVALIAIAFLYFEIIDLTEIFVGALKLVGELLKLIAGLVFAVCAFFVYLVTRRGTEKKS